MSVWLSAFGRTARAAVPIAAAMLLVSAPRAGSPTASSLTGADILARAYDSILGAHFDRAETELRRACGPLPPAACKVLEATSLWWRIQLDPGSRALDATFKERVNEAIAVAQAWTQKEPERAEAWFYLGGAYGARVQWRVLRGARLRAARDGKRIKDVLERALELDPDLHDAHFGIGLYRYYADVAPAAVRFLRWLLLLPGGDRVKGLAEMLQARARGQLLQGEADYQLHLLYLWYERQPARALALIEQLRARYPANPLFALRAAEIHDQYFHDRAASLAAYEELRSAARQRRVNAPDLAHVRARLGAARQLDALGDTDRAIEHLRAIVNRRPSAPYGVVAEAGVQLGAAYDRLGQRDLAVSAYQAAMAAAPADDPLDARGRARAGLRVAPDAKAAEAYRLSLEGWRALERHALADAEGALERSLSLRPADPVTRFRHGKLLVARRQPAAALDDFLEVIAARAAAPPTVLAAALLEAGRLLEPSDRGRAIEMYRGATGVAGCDARTRAAAERSLARLRVPRS